MISFPREFTPQYAGRRWPYRIGNRNLHRDYDDQCTERSRIEAMVLGSSAALREPVTKRIFGRAAVRLIDPVACWQEWRGSNPQPPVLETGALPVELHS